MGWCYIIQAHQYYTLANITKEVTSSGISAVFSIVLDLQEKLLTREVILCVTLFDLTDD